jgi:hypothetical protein
LVAAQEKYRDEPVADLSALSLEEVETACAEALPHVRALRTHIAKAYAGDAS